MFAKPVQDIIYDVTIKGGHGQKGTRPGGTRARGGTRGGNQG